MNFLILLLGGLVSCSTPRWYNAPPVPYVAPEKKPPQKKPPEKKKPEMIWICKVSNGAGRVFKAMDDSSVMAQSKARRECALSSRNCVLLDCSEIESED